MTLSPLLRLLSVGAAFGLLAFVGSPTEAAAQTTECTIFSPPGATTCTATNTVVVTVPTVMRLTVDPEETTIEADDVEDWEAWYDDVSDEVEGPVLTVKSNRAYNITIHAENDWTDTADRDGDKPKGDLEWRLDEVGAAGFVAMTGTGVDIFGDDQVPTEGTDHPIRYQSNWTWEDDPPGGYEIVVTFTLLAK